MKAAEHSFSIEMTTSTQTQAQKIARKECIFHTLQQSGMVFLEVLGSQPITIVFDKLAFKTEIQGRRILIRKW